MIKTFYVGVKGFIAKDGKVLLLKKAGEGFWEVPGGRIDGDETIEQALNRELQEEVRNCTNTRVRNIVGAFRLPKNIDGNTSLVLIYYIVTTDIDGEPKLSEEHDEYVWAGKDEAVRLMSDKKDIIEKAFDCL